MLTRIIILFRFSFVILMGHLPFAWLLEKVPPSSSPSDEESNAKRAHVRIQAVHDLNIDSKARVNSQAFQNTHLF